ncbi:hypothetical protein HPB48_018059 [Haemaphysalis longicornis]|uniref:Uncharacterized protein n=1 Tax=Haemaphysalis longicornis TaxID=44386 RepID=A0A9J6FN70_HAELO|nr:hypothetical protein HPB48_018059 [Haemaphysalis longicornis]
MWSPFFKENNLRILQSDKEGCFVVMPSGEFNERALVAITSNFAQRKVKPSRVKEKALAMCED